MKRELAIYGAIGAGGPTADSIRAKLQELGSGAVTVRINSPGGDVFDGLAMYNLIRAHGNVTVVIDGLAASAASFVALAAKRVTMAKEAMLMVHQPWSSMQGDADSLRDQADLLDKVKGQIAGIYAGRTNKTVADIERWFEEGDKWFTAEEAKAMGLIDEILVDEQIRACVSWKFASAPAAIAAKLDPVAAMQAENSRLQSELSKAKEAAAAARIDAELIGVVGITAEARGALVKSFLQDEAGARAVLATLKRSGAPERGNPPVRVAPSTAWNPHESTAGYQAYLKRLPQKR